MPLDMRHQVWLYCEKHPDGQVTDGKPEGEHQTFEIVDHLVCVPAGKLPELLLNAGEISMRFGGLQRVFIPWYRYATEEEVAAHLATSLTSIPAPAQPQHEPEAGEQRPVISGRRK